MANREELTFDGFVFANREDVEVAKNEAKKIAYIENHTDTSNLGNMKTVYEKLIETRTFSTPIGFLYLREIREALIKAGYPEESIPAVPLYTTFRRISLKDSPKPPRRFTEKEKEELSLKQRYRNSVIIAAIFGLLAAIMLIITLNGTTPNAINYKNAITNQYASWEQELSEREAAVREKERELNIMR